MPRIVLVTDTTADLPPALAAELGIVVVPATFAFADHTTRDDEMSSAGFYARMAAEPKPPRPFGVNEAGFRAAFEAIFAAGDEPFCLLTPFDVNPSFTIANAAMLSFDDVDMKVVNPGVSSAGLCSLLVTLSAGLAGGWDRKQLLDALDDLVPQCDSLFVPGSIEWLERAGRLAMLSEKLGDVEDGHLVVRVGTRITGVAVEESAQAALERAVKVGPTRGRTARRCHNRPRRLARSCRGRRATGAAAPQRRPRHRH